MLRSLVGSEMCIRDRLAGWLAGLLACWLACWLAGWLAGLLVGWLACWLAGCGCYGPKKQFEFFFENQFEKIQKILNLGTPRQRASQIENFQKILNLVPPWSPKAYIQRLRTCMFSSLGGTSLKKIRKFSNRYGVSGEQTASEIAPTQIWPKIQKSDLEMP